MTSAQKRLRELRDRQSKERGRMAELSREESLTDETRAELDRIETGTADLERQLRAATQAVETEDREAKIKGGQGGKQPEPELRERIELRGRASVGNYLSAALRGRAPTGAEAELQQAAKVDGIPFELWDVPGERRSEDRAITEAPGTVGVNLDPLRPMVFAPSVVDRLMIDMPVVESGTFASGTITTASTAGAVAKSAEVLETAAEWTVQTTTPHRIGASMKLTLEDIASVGQANFESLLRQHISLVLSDELDDQLLNGTGGGNNLTGMFQRLTPNPSAPVAAAETWTRFLAIQAGGVDGLWASEISDIGLLVGPETYRLAAVTFQGADAEDSAASYIKRTGAADSAFWTNKRMPLKANHIQQGILCRKGRSMMPSPMRTAVVPHWGYFSIDDIYSGAGKGERQFVINTLVGDLILVQPEAYSQVAFRVSV